VKTRQVQTVVMPEEAMLSELLNALIERGERIGVVYVSGHWLDVDSLADIERAGSFA